MCPCSTSSLLIIFLVDSVFGGGINAAATSVVVDIIGNAFGKRLHSESAVSASRWISLCLSLLALAISFAASHVHGLVSMGVVATALSSPLLGLFMLGLTVSRATASGGLLGLIVGVAMVSYIAAAYILCTSAPHCEGVTAVSNLSLFWLGLVGSMVTFVVGLLASLMTTETAPEFLVGLTFATRRRAHVHARHGGEEVESLVN